MRIFIGNKVSKKIYCDVPVDYLFLSISIIYGFLHLPILEIYPSPGQRTQYGMGRAAPFERFILDKFRK